MFYDSYVVFPLAELRCNTKPRRTQRMHKAPRISLLGSPGVLSILSGQKIYLTYVLRFLCGFSLRDMKMTLRSDLTTEDTKDAQGPGICSGFTGLLSG